MTAPAQGIESDIDTGTKNEHMLALRRWRRGVPVPENRNGESLSIGCH